MSLKHLASGGPASVAIWHQVCDEMDAAEARWIESLRARGVKAAHPDDGWVDREANAVAFAYPQFNDGAGIGDLIALGQPPRKDERKPSYRIVQIVGTVERWSGKQFRFEPTRAAAIRGEGK